MFGQVIIPKINKAKNFVILVALHKPSFILPSWLTGWEEMNSLVGQLVHQRAPRGPHTYSNDGGRGSDRCSYFISKKSHLQNFFTQNNIISQFFASAYFITYLLEN